MNPAPEEALFALALTKPADKRAAFLDVMCEGDAVLRQRLEALLAAHEQPETLLATQVNRRDELHESPSPSQGLAESCPLRDGPDEAVGQMIGRYKLLEKIGEGGCGVVYVAEQTEPVRRRVALKVIKLGMDTKQVVARFEAERQALAMMDHPNIAKVLDAGTIGEATPGNADFPVGPPRSADFPVGESAAKGEPPHAGWKTGVTGRPYFVMELVRGIKITDYCDQANLSTKERLDLFITVCNAIQHAHQKGIIHRDIKPSNILVTLHDGVPVPKVIDFGIAKATEGRLTDATVYTQLHQFIGTPAYMSPEQAEMSGLDIDTRSDIYSLGVLLYELLTGKTPFDAKELMAQGIDAMRRTIREKEPVRPSTKLSQTLVAANVSSLKSSTSGKPKTEEEVRADSRRLLRIKETITLLKGDLDWIVMKCLEKDRSRRYETANGLAADLKRHLNNEPVVARPPSAAYKFQKALRRNKLAFAAGAAVTAALLVGAVVASWQAVSATRARNLSVQAEQREAEQRVAAEAAQAEAARQRDLAQDRLLDSLIREMRSLSTIRPLGYRQALRDRVRLALELPQSGQRRDELRAEFTQGLGDPLGAEPVEVVWAPPLEPDVNVLLAGLSSDGQWAAVWRSDQTLVIFETRTGKRVAEIKDHELPRQGIAVLWLNPVFSTDGRALYGIVRRAGGADGPDAFTVAEWRRNPDGSWARRPRPAQPALAVMGTRDGVFAVLPAADEALQVLNLETGLSLGTFSPPLSTLRLGRTAPLAPKRGLIAFGTSPGVGRFSTAIEVRSLSGSPRHVRLEPLAGMGRFHSARFSPDEQYLACTGETGAVIYETKEFSIVSRVFGYFDEGYSGGAFVGDGSTVAVPAGQRPGIRLLSLISGIETHLQTLELVSDLVSSDNGLTLAYQSGQRAISFVRLADTRERRRLTGHVGGVTALEFSPDGRLIASTGKDGSVRFWDAASGTLLRTVARPSAMGQTVGFSPDGRWLAVGDYQHDQIQLFNVETGQEVLTLGEARIGSGLTWGCGFSPDGRRLVAVGNAGLRVWELAPWDERTNPSPWEAHLQMHEQGWFRNLLLDPAGQWVAFAGYTSDTTVGPEILIRSFDPSIAGGAGPAHSRSGVQSMGLLPVSHQIAFTALDEDAQRNRVEGERTLHFLDPATRDIVRSLPLLAPGERSSTYISNLRFSPDGTRLAAANHDGRRVNLYNVASGRRLYALPDDASVIWWLAWHPDGRRLAVARENGDISVWNLPEVEAAIAEAGLAP